MKNPASRQGFRRSLGNIWRLGVKELRSLAADKVMLFLIVWIFSGAIYTAATATSQELNNVPVAVVDEDGSPLARRIVGALAPPFFKPPEYVSLAAADRGMDEGRYTFAVVIPAHFQRDVIGGRQPTLSVNIDATAMTQAFIGASYINAMAQGEINEYLTGTRRTSESLIRLAPRVSFNPNLTGYWFGGVMEVINNVTMLTIILVGAAFLREREHGTLEHLLVMPLKPFEVMLAKIWANGLAVLAGATFALVVVVEWVLGVPIAGSIPLFLGSVTLYLFAAASIGIFLGTVARSMPQLGLLIILVIIPLQLLSGGVTPRESMPVFIQDIMLVAPTTYFVRLAQAILYRGAGFPVVWPDLLATVGVGSLFFVAALARFRQAVAQTQ